MVVQFGLGGLCNRVREITLYCISLKLYTKPMQKFGNGSQIIKFISFGDNTSSRIEHELETITLSRMQGN